jgi:nucleotide-binding universal stress UspA family protein
MSCSHPSGCPTSAPPGRRLSRNLGEASGSSDAGRVDTDDDRTQTLDNGGSMNILLAYNDTDVSNRALERAAQLAKLYEAKLVVTSVTPVAIGSAPDMSPGAELQKASSLLGERDVEAELVEAVGDIAQAIVEVAESHGAGLIVIGTREPSQVERMLGHSVSEQVQRMARCDVLIVH